MLFGTISMPNNATDEQIKFVNKLLSKQIFNDILFEELQFTMPITLDTPVQAFFRELWEHLYLKRDGSVRPLDQQFHTIITMSLSECIQYLQAIQTYIDKMKVYKDYRSTIAPEIKLDTVSDIVQSMQNVLNSTHNPDYPFYVTEFHRIFHLDMWQNNWIPAYDKISVAREFIDAPILAIVDASSMSVYDIMRLSAACTRNAYIQLTFHVDTLEDMVSLYHMINNCDLKLIGVQCNDIGLFVAAYAPYICSPIAKLVGDVYGQLQAINKQ